MSAEPQGGIEPPTAREQRAARTTEVAVLSQHTPAGTGASSHASNGNGASKPQRNRNADLRPIPDERGRVLAMPAPAPLPPDVAAGHRAAFVLLFFVGAICFAVGIFVGATVVAWVR